LANLRENRAKRKLERGEIVTVVSGLNTASMVDYLGQFGFDAAWIESEHGPVDFADIPDITRACDLWGMTSIVRVNQNNYGVIYRTLDLGAQGVAVPHVNTAEEARAVVEAAKFHPLGGRGITTSRQGYNVPDFVHQANDESLVMILIEDIVAIENLAEILTVDHIDCFFVAPGDLAQSMGRLGEPNHPEVQAVVDRAFEQIVGAGKVAGALTTDANVDHNIEMGVQFLNTQWTAWAEAGGRAFLDRVARAST
jgi:4-hydroxy-2-oxoheptanedioate aldolase